MQEAQRRRGTLGSSGGPVRKDRAAADRLGAPPSDRIGNHQRRVSAREPSSGRIGNYVVGTRLWPVSAVYGSDWDYVTGAVVAGFRQGRYGRRPTVPHFGAAVARFGLRRLRLGNRRFR